jgi:UMF1 family MFS transporter
MFGWPLFLLVKDIPKTGLKLTVAVQQGLADTWGTLKSLRQTPQLAWFLAASAIYRDGVTSILTLGGLYAGGTFGMDINQLTMFGMGLLVSAGLGAGTFAWLDDWIGSKRTIIVSLLGLIAFGAAIVLVHSMVWFVGIALGLGIFVGPAQAASRSLAARLAPEGQVGKVFGLYALTGRAVTFVGPTVFYWVTESTHSQRAGLASILVLLILGLAALTRVREPAR